MVELSKEHSNIMNVRVIERKNADTKQRRYIHTTLKEQNKIKIIDEPVCTVYLNKHQYVQACQDQRRIFHENIQRNYRNLKRKR